MSSHSSLHSESNDSSSNLDKPDNNIPSTFSSLDGSFGVATIHGPYRVGNADVDTCSYHALQKGESCRKPRTCFECLNINVAGVSDGCLLAPSGFCEDMSSYDYKLDYRRKTTGENLAITGWYNYFPSVNSTYCDSTDSACKLCDKLVNTSSSYLNSTNETMSIDAERHFCVGSNGCVCIMACQNSNWESDMPAKCTDSSDSGNDHSSSTSYSTVLLVYLFLQIILVAVLMYKHGFFRRAQPPRVPPRPEGPYNNVNAISSPSNQLRLSGWRRMQNELIEREKKQRAIQQSEFMAEAQVDATMESTEDITAPQDPLSPQDSARNNTSSYMQVQDEVRITSNDNKAIENIEEEDIFVRGSYEERRTDSGGTRSSTVAILEANRETV